VIIFGWLRPFTILGIKLDMSKRIEEARSGGTRR
jgi:hypothetical protein